MVKENGREEECRRDRRAGTVDMPEENKDQITEKSEAPAGTGSASGIAANRVPVRRMAVLILLSAAFLTFANQVFVDVLHLKRVSVELNNFEVRMTLNRFSARDRKLGDDLAEEVRKSEERKREILGEPSEKPRTDSDMELKALSQQKERLDEFRRGQSRLMEQKTAEIDDFLKRVYSDEKKYSRILVLVDCVWLIIATISAIAAFKGLAFANMSAQLFAGLTLLCALARVCASAAGTKDGYFNLLIWPLSMCNLGNSVFWPAAIMILWSVAVLCLSLKASETREERRRL